MNNKKAQGISLEVIIIAIIALVVLVLLIAIFTGRMGNWFTQLKGGEEIAYKCACINPADKSDETCGVASPGDDWSEKSVPAECGERFTDCANSCYSKAKETK